MKLVFHSFVLLLAMSLSVQIVAAPDTIRIAAPHITSLVEDNQSGIYQQILAKALTKGHIEAKQIYSPYKRALISFEERQVDCIYSFTKVLEDKLGKDKIISSFPLGAFAYYVFTDKDSKAIISVDQLNDLKVGAVIGHDSYYRKKLNSNTHLTMVNKDTQNLKKLELKRIDALIGALPDLYPYLDQLNYSPSNPLIESFDRISCHNTSKNQQFLNTLSPILRALKANGQYQKISGELFFEFDESLPTTN